MPVPSKSTVTSPETSDNHPVAPKLSRLKTRRESIVGWLFVLPALLMYVVFVLAPLLLTILYSLFKWNGVGPMTWVGLKNYMTILQVPNLIGTIKNAFWLVVWFSFVPVGLGLIVASIIHRVATGRFGAIARTVLFLPQVIPLVAAGIIWGWLLALPGLINQMLKAVGLGAITRAWLGDFNWALSAVGMVGVLGAAGILHRPSPNWHGQDRPGPL